MSNDPFTFDMFGGSALSSALGLGVTAFGGFSPDPANDDDPEHLSAAMLDLSRPDRLTRHAAAANARSRDYSLERMISETEAIYRGLIT